MPEFSVCFDSVSGIASGVVCRFCILKLLVNVHSLRKKEKCSLIDNCVKEENNFVRSMTRDHVQATK